MSLGARGEERAAGEGKEKVRDVSQKKKDLKKEHSLYQRKELLIFLFFPPTLSLLAL